MSCRWGVVMADPTIPEILRVGFKSAREIWGDPVGLNWPDDIDGQARCIRHLSDMVRNELLPHQWRTWAFDKLAELAHDYGEKGEPGSVPLEMFSWCFAVVSGAIERPKQRKGRDRHKNMIRDRQIIDAVKWLRELGYSKESARVIVAKAVEQDMNSEKSRKHPVSFGPAGVDQVLRKGDPIKEWKKEIDTFLSP